MTDKEKAAIKADDEIVKNAGLGEFIEGYALGGKTIAKVYLPAIGLFAGVLLFRMKIWEGVSVDEVIICSIAVLVFVFILLILFLCRKREEVVVCKDGFLWKTKNVFGGADMKMRYADIKGLCMMREFQTDKNGNFTSVEFCAIGNDNVKILEKTYGYRRSADSNDPFIEGTDEKTQQKSFCCDEADSGDVTIKVESLEALENPYSYESDYDGSEVLGFATAAIFKVWNRIALERANKELSENGCCRFYVINEDKSLSEVEIGRGYIKHAGYYAGKNARYAFCNGSMCIYPSNEDYSVSGKRDNFEIDVNHMYNSQIFLLVAIKLLGLDPNGELEKYRGVWNLWGKL